MDSEKRTGIQISQKPDKKEVSMVDGGIKITASEKPVAASFVVNWGKIYVLLDSSGSMKGHKLEQARLGILDFARDAFTREYMVGLIKFSDSALLLCEPSNDIETLQQWLKGIRAGGSTNLTDAIKIAHAKLNDFSGVKVIVIATDGMPDNVKSSLEFADKAKAGGIEILTIGTDDADQEFLNKLASGTGLSTRVNSDMFAKAISSASLLLPAPRSLKPK
jgi:Mg-chelatase subunit ChlD